jgi:hypothetical protein
MMNPYKDIEAGKPIRVSGWGLYHAFNGQPVLSGDCVYTLEKDKPAAAIVTSGTPPLSGKDEGYIWCRVLRDELTPRSYGLKWVKLDSEGEPLF